MKTRIPLWLLAMMLAAATSALPAAEPPIVAAASDLQFALPEIAEHFRADTGNRVRLNFGSSGNFRRQIAQGAPFELYLSADEDYVFALHDAGHTLDRGRLYAVGRIAIIAPAEHRAIVDETLAGLKKRMETDSLRRFAIANPEHAPYGVAARQALEHAGLWHAIRPRLILGENVAQAARFALSGETDGGIVAWSLALAAPVRQRAVHALIPQDYHEPLRQRMVLLRNAGETASRFYEYLQNDTARAILNRSGFELPEESR